MTHQLKVTEVIEAPPKAVLDGFFDMYGENRAAWIHRSELDLRVGGAWSVDFGPPGPPDFHEDRVITAYEPGRRLAYSMTATYEDAPPLRAEVEIDCEPLDGNTQVTLTQGDFATVEQRDEFENAWRDVLALLRSSVTTGH